ncbi:hypothetical protein [Paenarthrobacter ureafaciens]|uniref:hypothetical protein n=1 Tax=Paenarthrobacter ureafaciens TaxID=37931 RepID=UPI0034DB11C0
MSVLGALEKIDAHLFTGPYFRLDADNKKASQTFETAARARKMYPRAVVVGNVRPGVVAVDVDLDDDDAAEAILYQLRTWCEDYAAWHTTRRSGGGTGRWHFIAIPPAGQAVQLEELANALRDRSGYSGTDVDVRSTLRLLSSPHRKTGVIQALEDCPHELLAGLPRTVHPVVRRKSRPTTAVPAPDTDATLTRAQWAAFRSSPKLATRSHTEFEICRRLKGHGASPEAVWNALMTARSRSDIGHAKERNYAWFLINMWRKIRLVPASKEQRKGGRRRPADGYDWAAWALPMSANVRRLWSVWDGRHARTVEHVAIIAADRIGRSSDGRAPLPLRDLMEDTGRDIKTISAALRSLVDVGLLERVSRFSYSADVSSASDVYALGKAYVAPQSLTPTPRSYTPRSALWLALGSSALSLLLTTLHAGTSLSLRTLASASHYSSTPLSTRQRKLITGLLTELAQRNVLVQDGSDAWRNSTKGAAVQPRAGLRMLAAIRIRIEHERAAFRALVESQRECWNETWMVQKEAALEVMKRRRRQRQIQWWESLSAEERQLRQRIWKDHWSNASVAERQARKEHLKKQRPTTTDWELAA